jgi:hypothetical protein
MDESHLFRSIKQIEQRVYTDTTSVTENVSAIKQTFTNSITQILTFIYMYLTLFGLACVIRKI